jgi:hypothetical protein
VQLYQVFGYAAMALLFASCTLLALIQIKMTLRYGRFRAVGEPLNPTEMKFVKGAAVLFCGAVVLALVAAVLYAR